MPKRPSLRCSYLRAWAPTLLPTWIDNGHYIQSRPSAGVPEGPSGQTVPPVSFHPTGRFIVYNIALSIMWRLHCHASCYAAGYRRLPSAAAACAPTRRHSARQPHRSAGLVTGRGGWLAIARGDMSSRGGRASDATQRRAMAPFQVLPAIARRLLCAQTPHGWASVPHGGRPPTGHGPFGFPQTVWRAEGRLTISLNAQQFAHGGCSSPTRSQARHKNQTACEFCVAIRIIALVRLVACDGHPDVAPSSMRSWSLLVKNRHFFRIRAVCVP